MSTTEIKGVEATIEMKVAETTIEITCPSWCREDPEDHVAELDAWEGALVHRSHEDVIVDDRGSVTNIEDLVIRYDRPLVSHVHVTTDISGQALSSPGIVLDGRDVTPRQARELAASLIKLAAMAEEWSGRFDHYIDNRARAQAGARSDA